MKLTLLGTGNAAGIPVYGCACPACQRAGAEPARRRRSASALLETPQTRVLIDAGLTDLTQRFPPNSLSHILLTHYHADHVQGLFQLRWGKNLRIPVVSPDDPHGCDDLYKHPGILDFSQRAYPYCPLWLGDVHVTPLPLNHSRLTLGYCLEAGGKTVAYLTDTAGLQVEVQDFLQAAHPDVVVIDCSYPPCAVLPKGHNDLGTAIALHQHIAPRQTILTHIGHELDEWLLDNAGSLPDGVRVGWDGAETFL